MNTTLISIGLVLLIVSCSTKQQEDKDIDEAEEKSEIELESTVVHDPSEAIWLHDYNQQTGEFEIKQIRAVSHDTLSGEAIEKIINKTWPKVQIEFIRTSNDTTFIFIPDSEVLTQQMGTAGAKSFIISTTFSFTELKGISYVSFDFEEGDHGIPGVYTRNSWDKKIK